MNRTERSIRKRIETTHAKLTALAPILKGTISKVKAGTAGGRKFAYQLTWKGAGNKTRTLYVPVERLEEVKAMTEAYKKARACLEALAELHVDLYKTATTN